MRQATVQKRSFLVFERNPLCWWRRCACVRRCVTQLNIIQHTMQVLSNAAGAGVSNKEIQNSNFDSRQTNIWKKEQFLLVTRWRHWSLPCDSSSFHNDKVTTACDFIKSLINLANTLMTYQFVPLWFYPYPSRSGFCHNSINLKNNQRGYI